MSRFVETKYPGTDVLEEALEMTKVHSIVGLLGPGQELITQRPFRAPHRTVGAAGGMTFPSEFMLVAAMNRTPDRKMPGESSSSCENDQR